MNVKIKSKVEKQLKKLSTGNTTNNNGFQLSRDNLFYKEEARSEMKVAVTVLYVFLILRVSQLK